MLSRINGLLWWQQLLLALYPAVIILYLSMRRIRVIRCKTCGKRARYTTHSSERVQIDVHVKGNDHKIYKPFVADEIEVRYICSSGHVTVDHFYQEVGRRPEALWEDGGSAGMFWDLRRQKLRRIKPPKISKVSKTSDPEES